MTESAGNYRALIKILGTIVLITGCAMTIPWAYAEVTDEIWTVQAFRVCVPITLVTGLGISVLFRSDRSHFHARDGYMVVAFCWMLASLVGSFPYYLSGATETFIDALFESTSGFTTTGATIVAGGITSRSLILWKAVSHWLGGMGILVFVISILPALGISGQYIVRAETPGPTYQKFTTRVSSTARALYITYFSFTILEFILLMLSRKMSLFDAVINTLGCVSTGGLCADSAGVAAYDSLYVELVMAIFCLLASVNFVLYYNLFTGRILDILRDIELRVYLFIIAGATSLCGFNLVTVSGMKPGEALREAFVQTAFTASTAGYYRDNSFFWPAACQFVMLSLILIGGCAASTAGSVKVVRIMVMFRMLYRGMVRRIHPRSVVAIKLGGSAVSAPVVSGITIFLLTYAALLILTALILSLTEGSMETAMTTALAMISNTGAAVAQGHFINEFPFYSPGQKLYLCMLMIAGRLELFTVILLFTLGLWGRK